jgi:dienelactone hydrolase
MEDDMNLSQRKRAGLFLVSAIMLAASAFAADTSPAYLKWADTKLDSLRDLSVDALRARSYGSEITIVDWLGKAGGNNKYQAFYTPDASKSYNSYMAAYRSDGLRVYTRLDVPATKKPESGYPVVIFVHGWVGEKGAPAYGLNYAENSYYGDMIDAYVKAGYVVLTPGFRGHSTVHGIPAEGIEFLTAFDNGSYISPLFYAIDILNAVDGLQTLNDANWSVWGYSRREDVQVDLSRIFISGHSQGGDAVLTALAVSGEGSKLKNRIAAGSIWSGCFPDRITQLNTYGAMGESAEAFKAGSQPAFEWNGTARGSDGSVNPNFIFGYPPEWIGSVDASKWDWQKSYFKNSVEFMLRKKYDQMFTTFNAYVADQAKAAYSVAIGADGKVTMGIEPGIVAATNSMSAYLFPEYLKDEKIILHHSDQDYYAFPEWNAILTKNILGQGGYCVDFTYPRNVHELKKSKAAWFDPKLDAVAGRSYALKRDIALFDGADPKAVAYP